MHIYNFIWIWIVSAYSFQISETRNKRNDAIHVEILGPESEQKSTLKLVKPGDESVLHPNIKMIRVSDRESAKENGNFQGIGPLNKQTGKLHFDTWTPSSAELMAAEDLYIDQDNMAVVRVARDVEAGKHVALTGILDGNLITKGKVENNSNIGTEFDYIDTGRNLTPSLSRIDKNTPLTVEVLVVCDKDFGNLFNHDRRKILDYFTVYFWDINMRYKTLPSINLPIRVTGIVVIDSASGQSFIEEARGSDGRVSFSRALPLFSYWVYEHSSTLPKFDTAIAITNTTIEWWGGLAYLKGACHVDHGYKQRLSVTIINDAGFWREVTAAAHEIGHNLGAPHDLDHDFPGGCSDNGFIMSNGVFFFSTCSDRLISEFARSEQGSCLRRLDEPSQTTPISMDYSSVLTDISMTELCKLHLNNPTAYAPDGKSNCVDLNCLAYIGNVLIGWKLRMPVDNTPCLDGGRCFRGRCRKPGVLLKNVATGECAKATNPFTHSAPIEMTSCPDPISGATPLDTFVIEEGPKYGKVLQCPYATPNTSENGEKCVYTGNADEGQLWTHWCDLSNEWQGWDLEDVGGNEYLLKHRTTKRCAKPDGKLVRSYSACDSNDRGMRWKLVK